jgi:DNA-binding MarR family transcriptional regulator
MDDLLFALKRAHLAGNRFSWRLLMKLGLTPARFDLMRVLYARRDFAMAQSDLRKRLGVARATISRMLCVLEKLGWIERSVDPFDRRTRKVVLSYKARAIVWNALVTVVRPRIAADALDTALKIDHRVEDVDDERKKAEWLCRRVVWQLATPGSSMILSLVE